MLPILPTSQGKQRSHIRDMLQPFEQRYQIQQIIIRRIVNPAFYRDSIIYHSVSNKSSAAPSTTARTTYLDETCNSTGYYPKS